MSTYEMFSKLIALGPKVKCSRTGTYYHLTETNSDGKGGRIAKKHDVYIHDESVDKSKYRRGRGWQRGFLQGGNG